MNEGDPTRNPTIIAERGKVSAPEWTKKIIEKNRNLWKNKSCCNFEDHLNFWTNEIENKLDKLRGDENINPRFSVVVPAHNEEEYILQFLESVSNQKNNDGGVEVIIVVNDSNDRTAELSRKCGAKVIEYKQDKPYPPVAYARQKGLEEAKGEIILSTDADIIVGENWIEKMTKPLIKNTNISISVGNISNYEGKIPPPLTNPFNDILRKYEVNFIKSNSIVGFANIAVRKEDVLNVGGWPQKPVMEDTFLMRRLRSRGETIIPKEGSTVWSSGRREMVSIKDFINEKVKGGDHFIDREGKLKIVR